MRTFFGGWERAHFVFNFTHFSRFDPFFFNFTHFSRFDPFFYTDRIPVVETDDELVAPTRPDPRIIDNLNLRFQAPSLILLPEALRPEGAPNYVVALEKFLPSLKLINVSNLWKAIRLSLEAA